MNPTSKRNLQRFSVTCLVLAAVALAVSVAGIVATNDPGHLGATVARQQPRQQPQQQSTPTTDRPTTTTTVPPLEADDVALTVRTISKECFGTAGCLIEYSVDLELLDAWSPRNETYEVTYQVTGDEDGPAIGTLTLTGLEYTQDGYQSAMTPSSDTPLAATVVEVRAR